MKKSYQILKTVAQKDISRIKIYNKKIIEVAPRKTASNYK